MKTRRIQLLIAVLLISTGIVSAETYTLQQCIELAVRNNPGLKSGNMNIDISKSQTSQAYGNFLPKVSATAGMSGSDAVGSWNYGNSAGISAGLTLYAPGMYSGLKTAKLSEKVAEQTYRQSELDIINQVKTMYFRLLSTSELMAVYLENIAVAEENLKKTRQMYELGQITESDVLKSEVQKGDFQSQYLNYKQSYLGYKRSLNNLMGRRASEDLDVVALDVEKISIPDYSKAWEYLKKNNPVLRSSRLSREMRKMSLNASRESYLPSVSANYGYSHTLTNPGDVIANVQTAGITASWTLFNGLQRKQNVQQKKIALDQSEVDLESTLLNYEKLLTDYYTQYDIYGEMIKINEKRLASAKRDFEIVNQQYRIGNVTILDRMQAQLSVLSAESALSEATYSRMIIASEISKLINK